MQPIAALELGAPDLPAESSLFLEGLVFAEKGVAGPVLRDLSGKDLYLYYLSHNSGALLGSLAENRTS